MLYDLTDMIIGPIKNLLGQVVVWLSSLQLVAARGIDPAAYLGPFAWLSPEWLVLVKVIISASFLTVLVLSARAAYGLYLDIKSGVKWW